MTTRTDEHRPSAIDISAYEYIGAFYQGGSDDQSLGYRQEHQRLHHVIAADWRSKIGVAGGNYQTKNTCDHCGAHFAHGAIYEHTSGEYLVVGHICAAEVLDLGSQAEFVRKQAQKIADANKARRVNAEQRKLIYEENPGLEEALEFDHYIVADIRSRFHRGEPRISPKQVALVFKIVNEAKAKAEAPDPKDERTTPVVAGKAIEIEGIVRSVKLKETDYGSVWKMVVVDQRGFAVWGTVPKDLDQRSAWNPKLEEWDDRARVAVGDTVKFTSDVVASDDDPTFGFYKRPRKAEFVARYDSTNEAF